MAYIEQPLNFFRYDEKITKITGSISLISDSTLIHSSYKSLIFLDMNLHDDDDDKTYKIFVALNYCVRHKMVYFWINV